MRHQDTIGKWQLTKRISWRPNAEVWQVTRDGSELYALKRPHKTSGESYQRFANEVTTLENLKGWPGIMPVIEFGLPKVPSHKQPAYYVMPMMTPAKEAAADAAPEQIVAGVLAVATTLALLWREREVAHRDIKPENIFESQGRWYLGDFGLVKAPGLPAITGSSKKLGPVYYIAPEMLNSPADSDPSMADVYSLAKTLWVLLTGQTYPLPGPHILHEDRFHRYYALQSYLQFDPERLKRLDWLIVTATDISPNDRPSMAMFARELETWLQPRPTTEGMPTDLSHLAADISSVTQEGANRHSLQQARRRQLDDIWEQARPKLMPLLEHLRGALPNCDVTLEENWTVSQLCSTASRAVAARDWCVAVRPRGGMPCLWSGLGFSISENGNITIAAAHCIGNLVEFDTIWSESRQAPFGTPLQSEAVDELVGQLEHAVPTALAAYLEALKA